MEVDLKEVGYGLVESVTLVLTARGGEEAKDKKTGI